MDPTKTRIRPEVSLAQDDRTIEISANTIGGLEITIFDGPITPVALSRITVEGTLVGEYRLAGDEVMSVFSNLK